MLSDGRFWIGVGVGVLLYFGWLRYQASKSM